MLILIKKKIIYFIDEILFKNKNSVYLLIWVKNIILRRRLIIINWILYRLNFDLVIRIFLFILHFFIIFKFCILRIKKVGPLSRMRWVFRVNKVNFGLDLFLFIFSIFWDSFNNLKSSIFIFEVNIFDSSVKLFASVFDNNFRAFKVDLIFFNKSGWFILALGNIKTFSCIGFFFLNLLNFGVLVSFIRKVLFLVNVVNKVAVLESALNK